MRRRVLLHAPRRRGHVRVPVVRPAEPGGLGVRGLDRAHDAFRRVAVRPLRRQLDVVERRRPRRDGEDVVDFAARAVARAEVLHVRFQRRVDLPLQGAMDAAAVAVARIVDAAHVRQLAQARARAQGRERTVAEARAHAVGVDGMHAVRPVDPLHGIAPVLAVERHVDQRADLAVARVPAVAGREAGARVVLRRRRVGPGHFLAAVFHVTGHVQALQVERLAQPHVDAARDAAFELVRRRRLVHVQAADRLHGQVLVLQPAPVPREVLHAVQRGHDVRQAADDDLARLAPVAADLHAGDALQGVARGAVGEFADVFRVDRVDDLHGIALDRLGAADTAAQAGHRHLLDLCTRRRGARRRRRLRVGGLRIGGVRKQHKDGRGYGPESERDHAYLPFISNKFCQEANAKNGKPTHA